MARFTIIGLTLLALLAWWVSGWSYTNVSTYLDGFSPDGKVERYTPAFHARIQGNLRMLAGIGIVVGLALLLLRGRLGPMAPAIVGTGALSRFRRAVADVFDRYGKRTSSAHKQFVLLLILAGTLVRGYMLFMPITWDEAFTYTYFVTKPFPVIVADYSYPNNHILHTLLAKLSTMLFGVGKISLRLPAFLAGVLAMPVCYLFIRGMFNRYIAVLALALVAASGSLIEYSALARGYSITWLCMVSALALGRHFSKENDPVSAMLIAVVCALGMWSVPTMIYPALLVYIWSFLDITIRYKGSKLARLQLWFASGVLFTALTFFLYTPVILVHGVGQLFHHATMPDNSWYMFQDQHMEGVLDLWDRIIGTSRTWMAIVGILGFVFAGYVSARFRTLVVAMSLACIPLVLIKRHVAPPEAWSFILFILHLSTAIALFYVLKGLQDKALPKLGKRTRTVWAGSILLLGTGYTAMSVLPERMERFPQAASCAAYLADAYQVGDRIHVAHPLQVPVEFHCLTLGMDRALLHGSPTSGGLVFVVVDETHEQTLDGVLRAHETDASTFGPFKMVHDQDRTVIFAAPFGEQHAR